MPDRFDTDRFDTEVLPPLEYYVLETIGARYRLGHDGWTIHTKAAKAVYALEARGLVTWKHGVTEKSLLVWLTDEGKKAVLMEGYVAPILKESSKSPDAKMWLNAMKCVKVSEKFAQDVGTDVIFQLMGSGEPEPDKHGLKPFRRIVIEVVAS